VCAEATEARVADGAHFHSDALGSVAPPWSAASAAVAVAVVR
jgi:hypothetical protein